MRQERGLTDMKAIGKSVLMGLLVAAGGLLFTELGMDLFNGIPNGGGAAVGVGLYLCFVVVVCTGVILSKINSPK